MMKRALIAVAAIAVLSCTSSATRNDRVKLDLGQIVGAADTQMTGQFDVQLGLEVENPTTEAVTLKRIEVTQIGTGAWVLTRNTPFTSKQVIAAGTTAEVAFWVHAFQRIVPGTFGSSEPVSLRALVYFESPSGPFHQIVQRTITQF
jgi:hypothetical protein